MVLSEFLDEWYDKKEYILVHTSGSTGIPKPLWVAKERMRASARITCDFLALQPGNKALLCMPLDFIAGKMMVVRALERNLQLVEVAPSGNPLRTINGSIDFAAMVPMQVYNSLQVEQEKEKLRSIKQLIIGGGSIDARLEKELYTFPHAVWSTYGMTETLSHIALRRLNGEEADSWYTPLPHVQIDVNEEGCLVVNAPLLCDERLETHDIVEIKDEPIYNKVEDQSIIVRKFKILGRKDNVIDSGGIKIHIEKLEEQLRAHIACPFLITKKKDEKYGEMVVMLYQHSEKEYISIEEAEKDIYSQRLKSICESVLSPYQVPRLFLCVEVLPLTSAGKPKRAEAVSIAERWNSEKNGKKDM